MAAPYWITRPELVHVPYGANPLAKIAANTNWLYQKYSPAAVNIALMGDGGGTRAWTFALPASADALNYRMELHVWTSASIKVVAKLYCQSGASTGSWGTAVINHTENAAASSGDRWISDSGMAATIPAGTTHARLELTASSGDVQGHCVIIYPNENVIAVPTATTSAGFTPYDSSVLESVAGAGIHREMFNRVRENVRAILRDRPQSVIGWADIDTAATYRYNSTAGSHLVGGLFTPHIPGQGSGSITVRYRIDDTIGSGNSAELWQQGGPSTVLTVDDTDRTATVELGTDQPFFRLVTVPDTALSVKYLTADWTPGD